MLIAALYAVTSVAQTPVAIKLSENCKVAGVVFSSDYNPHGNLSFANSRSRFEPAYPNLMLTEQYLTENRPEVNYKDLGPYYSANKLKQLLCTFRRQYLGYVNSAGDSVIIVHLLNFKNKKKARAAFPDWQKSYVFAYGSFYEQNMVTFSVNLNKKIVEIY